MIVRKLFGTFVGYFFSATLLTSFGAAQLDSLKNLGHASMKIKTSDGKIVYIDPFAGTTADYADTADILLVTHGHNDHNQQNLVKKRAGTTVITYSTAVQGGVYKNFSVGNISTQAVPAYNGYHPAASSVGYIVEFNGIRLYHAGDTDYINEMAQLAAKDITYALLPVDGIYTMTPEDATYAASQIQADHNVPMHTMPPPDTYSDAIVARFTAPNKIIVKNGQTIGLTAPTTSATSATEIAKHFTLEQNFPNPFNPSTIFRFTLPRQTEITLDVFDLLGRNVTAVLRKEFPAGSHVYEWSAGHLPGGVYFYRLTSAHFSETKKMVLLK